MLNVVGTVAVCPKRLPQRSAVVARSLLPPSSQPALRRIPLMVRPLHWLSLAELRCAGRLAIVLLRLRRTGLFEIHL